MLKTGRRRWTEAAEAWWIGGGGGGRGFEQGSRGFAEVGSAGTVGRAAVCDCGWWLRVKESEERRSGGRTQGGGDVADERGRRS